MDVSWNVNQSLSYLSNCELCHSTSKPISDKEDTLKSFIDFDITSCGPVFRVVVGSQIVIPQQYLSEEKKKFIPFFYTRIHYRIETYVIVKLHYNKSQISDIVKPHVEIWKGNKNYKRRKRET